mgnify:CR=1 FL=1|tara:strand:+ start:6582 stop:8606 length:2025 start_codon:yes stop_codon:yes gene_type:complete
MKNLNSVSSYWLDDSLSLDNLDDLKEKAAARKDPIRLHAYRNAVSNFVRIVTGENIKVQFEGRQSYTDGKSVTIGASLKDADFDPAVGLALHEGSHIKLTDFKVLKDIDDFIQKHDKECEMIAEKYGMEDRWDSTFYIKSKLSDLLNVVEDRRIDNYIYKSAPGYQGYYKALYDKYFNAKIVDKGLESSEYRTEDWESYMFRIINLTNSHRDLNALENLKSIWDIMDLKNIDRLKTTTDALNVAWDIFMAIENSIPKPEQKAEEQENESKKGDGESDSGDVDESGSGNDAETPEGEAPDDDGSKAEGSDVEKGSGSGKEVANTAPELSSRQKQQLTKAIEKQKDFNKGKIKKTTVTKKLNELVEAMSKAGVSEEEVEFEGQHWNKSKIKVTVIREFNMKTIEGIDCGMWTNPNWSSEGRHKEEVAKGIRLGTILGKKLKVRAEEKSTKYNRQRSGKIDKRMIANAGYGMENIFSKLESFSYNPGIIHISIDNSGSMSGRRLEKSITTATAIAKACSMIGNMDCVISFRAGSYFENEHKPVMLIAYDSRKDGIVKLKQMLPYITSAGSTPEGLCFDAIMKEIVDGAKGKDAYFVNFSDGAPYYGAYYGEPAHKHTRKQTNKMIREGIKVISYFIDGSEYYMENFRSMYGKNAESIDVSNISAVARVMNKKFLETV